MPGSSRRSLNIYFKGIAQYVFLRAPVSPLVCQHDRVQSIVCHRGLASGDLLLKIRFLTGVYTKMISLLYLDKLEAYTMAVISLAPVTRWTK